MSTCPLLLRVSCVYITAPVSQTPFHLFLSSFSEVEDSFVDIAPPGVVLCSAESTAHRCPCRVFLYVLFPQAVPVATSSSSSGRLSPSFLRSPLVLPWPEMPRARGLLETELSSSVSWQTSSHLDKTWLWPCRRNPCMPSNKSLQLSIENNLWLWLGGCLHGGLWILKMWTQGLCLQNWLGAQQSRQGADNREVAELGFGGGLTLFSQILWVCCLFPEGWDDEQTPISGEAQWYSGDRIWPRGGWMPLPPEQ